MDEALTQNQEGGSITFVLPATPADGSDLHLNIHSFQNHVTLDHVGGTIFLELPTPDWSHTFSALSYDEPNIAVHNYKTCAISATDRSSFSVTLDGTNKVFYIKSYADRRKIHHQRFVKHFDKTAADYDSVAKAFELPRGFESYQISFGDGTATSANDNECYVKAHTSIPVGTRVEVSYLFPSYAHGSGLFWVDQANEDHILPGGGPASSPAYFSQSSNGRKRHCMHRTSTTRWTQHRTM